MPNAIFAQKGQYLPCFGGDFFYHNRSFMSDKNSTSVNIERFDFQSEKKKKRNREF